MYFFLSDRNGFIINNIFLHCKYLCLKSMFPLRTKEKVADSYLESNNDW